MTKYCCGLKTHQIDVHACAGCWLLTLLTGGENTQDVTEPTCRLECKLLTAEDYETLLLTTFAEFPGNF